MLTNVNFLSHKSHWYGFSPVWIRLWCFKSSDRANFLSHMSHEYGFSPVFLFPIQKCNYNATVETIKRVSTVINWLVSRYKKDYQHLHIASKFRYKTRIVLSSRLLGFKEFSTKKFINFRNWVFVFYKVLFFIKFYQIIFQQIQIIQILHVIALKQN